MAPKMERLWILAYRWERRLQRSADWCVETPWLPRWPCWPLADALNALSTTPHDWCVRYPAYRRRCLAHWRQRLTVLVQDRHDPRRWAGITEVFGPLGRRHHMTLTDGEDTERRAYLVVRRTYTALQYEGRRPAWRGRPVARPTENRRHRVAFRMHRRQHHHIHQQSAAGTTD